MYLAQGLRIIKQLDALQIDRLSAVQLISILCTPFAFSTDTAPRYRATNIERVPIAPAFICERGHLRVPVDQIPGHSHTGQAHGRAVIADSQYRAGVVVLEHKVEVVHKAETVTLPAEL